MSKIIPEKSFRTFYFFIKRKAKVNIIFLLKVLIDNFGTILPACKLKKWQVDK